MYFFMTDTTTYFLFVLVFVSSKVSCYNQNKPYGPNLGQFKGYNDHLQYEQQQQVAEEEAPIEEDRPKIRVGFRLKLPAFKVDLPPVNLPKITINAKIQQSNRPRTIRIPEINLDTSRKIASPIKVNPSTGFNAQNQIWSELKDKSHHIPNSNYGHINQRNPTNINYQSSSYDAAPSSQIATKTKPADDIILNERLQYRFNNHKDGLNDDSDISPTSGDNNHLPWYNGEIDNNKYVQLAPGQPQTDSFKSSPMTASSSLTPTLVSSHYVTSKPRAPFRMRLKNLLKLL